MNKKEIQQSDRNHTKKNQKEILELKNILTEFKHSKESFYSRLDQVEEIISELKDSSFEITSQRNINNKEQKKCEMIL